jgi:hypothetical protein
MSDFWLYFTIGREHIANLKGLDHILFVAALCVRYQFTDWKKLLILVTAFTIGHSITLVLSVFNFIHYSVKWIEFLIPVTIIITALSNLQVKKFANKNKYPFIYFAALFFGLIHGLGFSNYLKSLLGRGQVVVVQLLAFNLGLEFGQLIIVLAVLLLTFICLDIFKINRREYILFLSGGIFGVAVQMALQRIPFNF